MKRTARKNRSESIYSYFDTMPNELITEVLSYVASFSLFDLYNAKTSCKLFRNIGEESYIYKKATLKKFPVATWWPTTKQVDLFLNKCFESGNPEALYRRGLIDYFGEKRVDFAFKCLEKAARFGHIEALYLISIILIFQGGEYKEKGMKMLAEMKKITALKKQVTECRKNLKEILPKIWIRNSLIVEQRPKCCTINEHLIKKHRGWPLLDHEDDNTECEACLCDQEVANVCNCLPHLTR